ncbi:MAG: tRNA (guanosine(46)-N7)-methyltransferase TrmB [Planctomycetaceae bacterium]|nr:tRNA (guanosine(46)-N7)-methyltransferase TrmB [Planctomycetaceae bacterium]
MKNAPTVDLRPYFQTLDDLSPSIDWDEMFEKDQPIELDVGCGRGLFLFTASTTRLDTNFVGIELDYREGRRAAKRLAKLEQPNGRVLGGDAREALGKMIEPASVSAVHFYFPDPWWKKKHKRRRLFTDQFANMIARVLKPGGHLHSWTDVEDYFGVIQALMDHHADFVTLDPPDERDPEHDMDYQTSFERKKRKEGFPIYRGLWQRR